MTQEHQITPSQALVDKWVAMLEHHDDIDVFSVIARWGADQELEACCVWVDITGWWSAGDILCAARRSKPLSLKDEVKQIIDCLIVGDCLNDEDALILHRALKFLPS